MPQPVGVGQLLGPDPHLNHPPRRALQAREPASGSRVRSSCRNLRATAEPAYLLGLLCACAVAMPGNADVA